MRANGAVTGLDNDGIVSRAQGCLLGQLAGDALLRCRPEAGRAGVHHPRPEVFWPVDALDLAAKLVHTP